MSHTPTPWYGWENGKAITVRSASGRVCSMAIRTDSSRVDEGRASAAFIALAVNNHAELVKALERQCNNMSFVVNNADLHGFYDKFKDELEEDRAALKSAGAAT